MTLRKWGRVEGVDKYKNRLLKERRFLGGEVKWKKTD